MPLTLFIISFSIACLTLSHTASLVFTMFIVHYLSSLANMEAPRAQGSLFSVQMHIKLLECLE